MAQKVVILNFVQGKENDHVFIPSRNKLLKDLPKGVVYMEHNKNHKTELELLKKKHPRYFEDGTFSLEPIKLVDSAKKEYLSKSTSFKNPNNEEKI